MIMMMKVVVLLVALLCATIFAAEPDYVETKNGLVMGEAYEKHREFKGIPYGAAPTGERRFASPQPAAPWAPHVYNATSYGAICPCPGNVAVGALPFVHVDEDCLFLNVYAPSRDRISEPLPVMFWMYGGAYIFGDGHSLGLYDGDYLATTRDVIVVTINYRLAAFGFFYIEGKANGNQGIEDQRLALQWTIDNIANFGGDPKRITIFGESAGAMSVAAHLTSPLSAGMFQRAIMQSDPASLHWKTPAQATDISDKVARNVRCDEGDIDCLREVGWRELAYIRIPTFPAGIEDLVGDFLTWTPTVDGANLMKDTVDAFAAGEFNDVPVIIGTNRDEMSLFEGLIDFFGLIRIGPILYEIIIGIAFQDAKDAVLKQYPAKLIENNYHQIFQVFSDYIFKCSSRNVANSLVKYAKSPVYSYEFTHVPEYKPGLTIAGRICYKHYVCHAQELTYVFHSDEMYGIPLGDDFTADDEAASQHFMRHWVGFASGDINGLNPSVQWAPYSNSSLNLLEISATTRMRATDDICDFWDSLGYRF